VQYIMCIDINTYFLLFSTIEGLVRFDRPEDNVDDAARVIDQFTGYVYTIIIFSNSVFLAFA